MTKKNNPHYLLLGEILRPHGVLGEVRVRLLTDYPERMKKLKTAYLGNDPEKPNATPIDLESVRHTQDYALVKFSESHSRNDAEAYRGLYLMIDFDNAIPLDNDEYYSYELIGLTVKTVQGDEIGTVTDIMETGANDVLIVKSEVLGQVLLPAHSQTMVDINFDEGIITMDLPEGLLPS